MSLIEFTAYVTYKSKRVRKMGSHANSKRRWNFGLPVVTLSIYFTDDWSARTFYDDSEIFKDVIDNDSSVCGIRVEMRGIGYREGRQSGTYRAM
jgi:hypothetical protein